MRLTKCFSAPKPHANHVTPALELLTIPNTKVNASLQIVLLFPRSKASYSKKEKLKKITIPRATDAGKRPLSLSETLCDQGSYNLYKADACLNALLKAVMASTSKQLTINYKD